MAPEITAVSYPKSKPPSAATEVIKRRNDTRTGTGCETVYVSLPGGTCDISALCLIVNVQVGRTATTLKVSSLRVTIDNGLKDKIYV